MAGNYQKKLYENGSIDELTPGRNKRKNEDYRSSAESKKSNNNDDGDLIFQGSYKKMAELNIVRIIHKEHPSLFLTKKVSQDLQNMVNNLIDMEPDECIEVKMQYCKVLDGGLEFGCASVTTSNWLTSKVTELENKADFKLKLTDRWCHPLL